MKKQRLDDSFYLLEDRRFRPKEIFKIGAQIVNDYRKEGRGIGRLRILDIGCATGDFLCYMSQLEGPSDLYGGDVREDLIALARARVDKATFGLVDISETASAESFIDQCGGCFDVTTMFGVNAIFDDCKWVKNLSLLTIKDGLSIVFGPFNKTNLDLLVGVRESGTEIVRSGYNTLSINTLISSLEDCGRKFRVSINDFVMPFDLDEQEDPLRAFTLNTAERGRIQINGLGLLRPQVFAVVHWDKD